MEGQAVSRAKRIEEAARRVANDASPDGRLDHVEYSVSAMFVNDLRAALAAPEDDGDAAKVIHRTLDAEGRLSKDDDPISEQIARALSAAGLLARPVDRERLRGVIDGALRIRRSGEDAADAVADAIIREVGR